MAEHSSFPSFNARNTVNPHYRRLSLAPILTVNGLVLMALAIMMVLPLTLALYTSARAEAGTTSEVLTFTLSLTLTAFVGVSLWMAGRGRSVKNFSARDTFILTVSAWLISCAFASLPFFFSHNLDMSASAIVFETVSGMTSSGGTAIANVSLLPDEINLWRAVTQWYGGIGIIVMALAVLPLLNIGGMQLFRLESSDKSEKVTPRATEYALYIALIYLVFSCLCLISFYMAGMSFFDAVIHMMTTVSTGGFSSHANSIGYFNSSTIEWIAIVFMILGALPFGLYIVFLRGELDSEKADPQIRLFLWFIVIATVLLLPAAHTDANTFTDTLRETLFSVVSIITTTGHSVTDHSAWAPYAVIVFLILTQLGGCSGSTSGGLKTWRVYVLFSAIRSHVLHLNFPRGIFPLRYGHRFADDGIASAAFVLFFIWILIFFVGAIMLMMMGLDTMTAFSASASSISNVGVGLGPTIGPYGSYATLPDEALAVLSVQMLLGRLEIMTVLTLLIPSFWRS